MQKQLSGFTCVWIMLLFFLPTGSVVAAPSAHLWPRWQANVATSTRVVDHGLWDQVLGNVRVAQSSGINRFNYKGISLKDRQALTSYLDRMQQVKVSELNRLEQKAFWINVYNAQTIQVVLAHYPVESILNVDISPGFFSNGPWDAKLLVIESVELSLNDIEHRILRPIFKDNRVHYALNCASLGCPNLQPVAFTAENMEEFLHAGAVAYVNHPRGVQMVAGKLRVSSIYKWFQEDFGGTEEQVIAHLHQFAEPQLARALVAYEGSLNFDYNWQLNQ